MGGSFTNPMNVIFRRLGKPIRAVLRWQFAATALMTAAAGAAVGIHGAASAAAGGSISMVAGFVAALIAARRGSKTAGGVLMGALKAEIVKIGLAIVLLGLVLASYAEVVAGVLLGAFVVTMLIFSMAILVREY